MTRLLLLLCMMLLPQYVPTGAHFPNGAPPPNPCLISGWPMNEGSGLTLHDISGNGNDATINTGASVTWQSNAGLPGTTPYWNGSGYALATSTTLTNFTGTTAFSASAWFVNNPSGTSSGALLGTLQTANNFKGWAAVGVIAGGHMVPENYVISSYPGSAIDINTTSGNNWPPGLGYMVMTYDGSQTAAGLKAYINATLAPPTVVVNSLSSSTANGLPVRFGAWDNGTEEWTGPMAFAAVYNCVLTPTEIATYYAAGPGIY